jgi:hypothetical protein
MQLCGWRGTSRETLSARLPISNLTDQAAKSFINKSTNIEQRYSDIPTMAPIRRYLRITKYSVLECRIYLDNPALAESWLLNYRNPILPRVIESVRPLVLPKLREEKERSKKGGKKKGVKDVVVEGLQMMPRLFRAIADFSRGF